MKRPCWWLGDVIQGGDVQNKSSNSAQPNPYGMPLMAKRETIIEVQKASLQIFKEPLLTLNAMNLKQTPFYQIQPTDTSANQMKQGCNIIPSPVIMTECLTQNKIISLKPKLP